MQKNKVSGIATSPMLIAGLVVYCGKGQKRTKALDALTGKERWSVDGSADGSFMPMEISGEAYLLTSFGKLLRAKDGSVALDNMLGGGFKDEAGDTAANWGPTSVASDGLAFTHVHFKKSSMNNTAIRAWNLPGSKNAGTMAWEFYTNADANIRGRMGRSFVVVDHLLYAVKDNGLLQVLDTNNGSLVYEREKVGGGYPSLSFAGGNLYNVSKTEVVVFQPGRTYKEVSRFVPGVTANIASPVFVAQQVFFRDATTLWCFGSK